MRASTLHQDLGVDRPVFSSGPRPAGPIANPAGPVHRRASAGSGSGGAAGSGRRDGRGTGRSSRTRPALARGAWRVSIPDGRRSGCSESRGGGSRVEPHLSGVRRSRRISSSPSLLPRIEVKRPDPKKNVVFAFLKSHSIVHDAAVSSLGIPDNSVDGFSSGDPARDDTSYR